MANADANILILNLNIMDLDAKRQHLLKEKEQFEEIKKSAHASILKINADLRKLDGLMKHANELFPEQTIDGLPLQDCDRIVLAGDEKPLV